MELRRTEAPVQAAMRVEKLDVLRGFSVLGILLMNIQSFAMIMAAYTNPMAAGGTDLPNMLTWAAGLLLADQKFMTLFSVLYGAGIYLFCTRLENRGTYALPLFFKRSLWLVMFGLAHAYGLWYGDILFSYALTGLVVYPLYRQPPARLCLIAGLAMLVPCVLFIGLGTLAAHATGAEKAVFVDAWMPGADTIAQEIANFRGTWWQQMPIRLDKAVNMQVFGLPVYILWRSGALMLLGMALMKWDVLTGNRPKAFYQRLVAICLPIGMCIGLAGLYVHLDGNFAMVSSKFGARQFTYWGSLFMAAAYLGLIMLLPPGRISGILAPAGRMAFTNYLGQTVICTFLFYGHGLGWFGKVDRVGQWLVVLAVWTFQLLSSKWWLARFRFGPMEWLWRSLTYGRLQPLRR